jgi:hypothetical protein
MESRVAQKFKRQEREELWLPRSFISLNRRILYDAALAAAHMAQQFMYENDHQWENQKNLNN